MLHGWRRFVCVGHVSPDADSLGAVFAMARAWGASGQARVSVALPEGTLSRRLTFLRDIADCPLAEAEDFASADGFLVADTARASRCNLPKAVAAEWPMGKPVVVVDHHVSSTRFGTVNWVEERAASACELVYALLNEAGVAIDPNTASLLYAGILTDTVGFSLPTATAFALGAAGELVALGADVRRLGERINRSLSPTEFRLLRTIYANTHLAADGRIAYSTASHEEINSANCSAADIDEQVSVPRSIEGIRLAMLFSEGNRGKTRINFRGENGTNVLGLARKFDGGGHREAAGAVVNADVEEAVRRVLPVAIEWLDGGESVESAST